MRWSFNKTKLILLSLAQRISFQSAKHCCSSFRSAVLLTLAVADGSWALHLACRPSFSPRGRGCWGWGGAAANQGTAPGSLGWGQRRVRGTKQILAWISAAVC